MFFLPGFVISILTFPGVIVHEAAHAFFCRMFKAPILEVKYFQFGNPAGYVIHGDPENFKGHFFITMGPFIINSALCILFCSAAFLPVWVLNIKDPLSWFFYWLGLSIGMHAFPSTQDLKVLWRNAPRQAKAHDPWALLSLPLIVILYPLNFLRVIWADLGYGIAIGVLVPIALFKFLA
jgi:hypothetical protein